MIKQCFVPKTSWPCLKRRFAMTFAEILVACLLLVVVFIIGLAVSSSFTGVKKVRDYETAIYLANQAIEAVRAARYSEIGEDKSSTRHTLLADFNSSKEPYDKNGEGFVPKITIGGVEYTREVSIEPIKSSNQHVGSGLKLIKINVSWRSSEDNEPLNYEVITTQSEQW